MGGACSIHGITRNAYKILVAKLLAEGKKPLCHRWEYNTGIDLKRYNVRM
jgi:hypothetical protein